MFIAGVWGGVGPFAVLASLCLGACAQITVISDTAPPKTEWKFGVLAVDLANANENTIVHAQGIGLVSTPSGATLGYANAKIVRMGDECRIVIATKDLEAISKDRELLRLLKTTHKACAA
jgi:hypothetical protein